MDFSHHHKFIDHTGQLGLIQNCQNDTCQYLPNPNLSVGYDGQTLASPATAIDTFTLEVTDSKGASANNSVAIIIRDVNDPPAINNFAATLAENEIFNQLFTLSSDVQASPGHIIDYDERSHLKNIKFIISTADPNGESECLSGQSIMDDPVDAGDDGSPPFNRGADNILYCDTGKGVAEISLTNTHNNSRFTETSIKFFPNPNFFRTCQI